MFTVAYVLTFSLTCFLGNLFSVSPREEKLEKARLLAEQRATDKRLRKEEEEKNAAEERAKRREKRQKVLQELVDTEKDYLFDLQLCLSTFFDSDSAIKVGPLCCFTYLQSSGRWIFHNFAINVVAFSSRKLP